MSGTVLVVDGETPLGRALVRRFREEKWRVVTTGRKSESGGSSEDGADVIRAPWGKASPVSARNVLLKTLAAHERLDLAVFPFNPALKRVLLHEAEYTEIELAVDEWVLGTLYLLREVLGQMVRQGKGLLALVQGHRVAGVHPPLEAMIRGGLAELSSSLLASYGGNEVSVFRFETDSSNHDLYAQFIQRRMDAATTRAPGRVFRFHERAGGAGPLGLWGRITGRGGRARGA